MRNTVNNVIFTELGSTATFYDYTNATITTDDEGGKTVSSWSTGTSIKVIASSDNPKIKKIAPHMDEWEGELNLLVQSTISADIKDRITFSGTEYEVIKIHEIKPIQDVTIVKRFELARKEDTTNW